MGRKNNTYRRRHAVMVNTIIAFVCFLFILPMAAVIAISLSNEKTLIQEGYKLIPSQIDLSAYKLIFNAPVRIIRAYGVTILVTVCGTIGGLLLNSMAAYPMSRKSFKLKNIFTFFFFFTMLFRGGLVPFYIFIKNGLGLHDKIIVLIFPTLVMAFYILVLRTYFKGLPAELIESAKLDGAGEILIFSRIVLPLSIPVLATVGLFLAVQYWNDWWFSLLFIDSPEKYPLQMLLREVLQNVEIARSEMASKMPSHMQQSLQVPSESMRMAMCIVAAGPMLVIFPFFQKYFVRGLTIGALKG